MHLKPFGELHNLPGNAEVHYINLDWKTQATWQSRKTYLTALAEGPERL